MNPTELCFSGLAVSPVSFGCWELGGGKWQKGDDAENIRLIRTARDRGITVFDTAVNYGDGHSEAVVGLAVAPFRTDCILATKVRPDMLREADVYASVEGSLRRLHTEYIDLLYVHWPNDAIPIDETMGAFARLREQGKIRGIGVSNFSIRQLRRAAACVKPDAVQMEYSLLQRSVEAEIVPFCTARQIGIFSYSTNAKGILAGVFRGGRALPADDFRAARRLFKPEHMRLAEPLLDTVETIARRHDAAPAQVAIAWVLTRPGMTSAIFGTQNFRHLDENIRAAQLSLTPDETALLTSASDEALAKIDA